MPERERACFVIMPFVPELHYLYLYLEHYLGEHHGIRCERADRKVLTRPFMEKIAQQIGDADVIIADCSGRNANVFYELGIAHATQKHVILVTHDPVEEAPSDIRHYEFIRYELDKHTEFLAKLDNALHNVFVGEYRSLYERAGALLHEFNAATGAGVSLASEQEFVTRIRLLESRGEAPASDDESALRRFLLPSAIADANAFAVMEAITAWLSA